MSEKWLKLSEVVYRKEILPIGKYHKKDDNLDFEITSDFLVGMKASFDGMQKNGVSVPLVKGHDGDSSFGNIVGMAIKNDSAFVDIAFANDDAKKEALANDVSAFIPPDFIDGKGNQWKRPLRHLALTPYPVIPGLSKWEAVAASHNTSFLTCDKDTDYDTLFLSSNGSDKGDLEMEDKTLDALAGTLQLSFNDDDDKAAREAVLVQSVTKLTKQSLELASELQKSRKSLSLASNGKPAEKKVYPTAIVEQVGESRKMKVQALLLANKINPAVAKDLQEEYCSNDQVSLALSHGEGVEDGFSKLVKMLEKNDVLASEGRHFEESIQLSHETGKGDSILVKQAKAKAANK